MLDLSFVYLRPLDFFSTLPLHRSPVRAFVRPSVCFFVRLFSHLVIDHIILSLDGLSVCQLRSLFVPSVVR